MTTTNPRTLADRARSAIRGYDDAIAIQRNATVITPEAPEAVATARANVAQVIRDHLRTGELLPNGLVDQLVQAEALQRAHDVIVGLIADEARHAAATIEFLTSDPDPAAFEYLNQEMTQLVTEARELISNLDGATTADEAVANGADAVSAWGRLQKLADKYDEIRTVQKDLTPSETLQFWDRLTTTGAYRDAATVHPRFTGTGPALSSEYGWWPDGLDRTAGLVRIVTTADPWVPPVEEMNAAYDSTSKVSHRAR